MEITEDPEEDSLSERPQVGLMDDHENPDSRKNDDQIQSQLQSHVAREDIPSDHELIEAILADSPSPSPSPRMRKKRKNSQESSGERKKYEWIQLLHYND